MSMEDKCTNCKKTTECNRCAEWCKTSRAMPLIGGEILNTKERGKSHCEDCIFPDDYYGDICGECYNYLESIDWNSERISESFYSNELSTLGRCVHKSTISSVESDEKKPFVRSIRCANCKTRTLCPAECGRCAAGHGDPEPLCEICIFQDAYYGNVCSECHGYLEANQ